MSDDFRSSPKFPFASSTQNRNYRSSASWQWKDFSEDNLVKEYLQDTGLHGFQYIGQKGRHFCERIFWILAILTSVTGGVVLIYKMWTGFLNMPIMTVFSSQEKLVHEIPFPSVTICNVNSMQKSKVEEYLRKVTGGKATNQTEVLQAYAALADYQQVCYSSLSVLEKVLWVKSGKFSKIIRMPMKIQEELDRLESDYRKYRDRQHIDQMSQSCEEMILFCVLRSKVQNCSELFKKVPTDFGFCCTFNTIPINILKKPENAEAEEEHVSSDWESINNENLISSSEKVDAGGFPLRQMFAGRTAGLSFVVNPKLKEYTCTKMDSNGFLLSLNRPLDYPSMSVSNQLVIPVDSEVVIGVRPEIIVPDLSMDKFNVDVRGCYLTNEFGLKYFTKYTQLNCFMECVSNLTMSSCGCVHYFMPNGANHKLCTTYDDMICITKRSADYASHSVSKFCPLCLPTCTKINYYPEISSFKINQERLAVFKEDLTELNSTSNVSIVHVFLSIGSVFPMLRKEVYTTIDLVSNAGGLLGLCMGFSILSLLEIFYYFSLRIVCTFYKRKNESGMGMSAHGKMNEIFRVQRSQTEINKVFEGTRSSNKVLAIVENEGESKLSKVRLRNWYEQ